MQDGSTRALVGFTCCDGPYELEERDDLTCAARDDIVCRDVEHEHVRERTRHRAAPARGQLLKNVKEVLVERVAKVEARR